MRDTRDERISSVLYENRLAPPDKNCLFRDILKILQSTINSAARRKLWEKTAETSRAKTVRSFESREREKERESLFSLPRTYIHTNSLYRFLQRTATVVKFGKECKVTRRSPFSGRLGYRAFSLQHASLTVVSLPNLMPRAIRRRPA